MATLILIAPILGLLLAALGVGILIGTLIGPRETLAYIVGAGITAIGGALIVSLWV